jgi:small-conductance mechanosensitive channel
MNKIFLLLLFFMTYLISSEKIDYIDDINEINSKIVQLQLDIKENILIKRYNSYLAYRKISKEVDKLKLDYKRYSKWKGDKYKELSYNLNNKIRIKENELSLISEYKDSAIGKLVSPNEIKKSSLVTNPFGIITALIYINKLENQKKDFATLSEDLSQLVFELEEDINLYNELYDLNKSLKRKESTLKFLKRRKKDFLSVLDIVKTTNKVYSRKIEELIIIKHKEISDQIEKSVIILIIIFFMFLISFLFKFALKKYFIENENYYMGNKIINVLLIFLIVMILMFSYIDNVSYLVTILGFASAGIAIALKDWFMSIFGWLVIVTSGSIHVGDRIKVQRNNIEVVGDVLDISLFKITIREDITLTSYMKNRRTGRIFFIPNNYVFSEMIANYTHAGLRTVWDGIDITITFDSNHKKAISISKEILKNHSKGYTDITRKQLNKMRSKYSLRSTGVEPRVYSFVESYGIVISSWYLTNSYAALTLRSTMGPEILKAFMKEDDIHIAYPTQSIDVKNSINKNHILIDNSNTQMDL